MNTLFLVIGVNLLVFGWTALGRARKGFKPFAGNQPLAPEYRTLTFALSWLAMAVGVVLLVLSYMWIVGF